MPRRLLRLQAMRFLLSGGLVALVAITLTVSLRAVGLDFQIAFLASYVSR